jgi:type I restriction enzyme S subunit
MSQISVEGIDTSVVNRWKRYPAYKDSGVEWLGEIPEHWKVLSVRRLAGVIEQGWSPVAEDRLASEDEWGVIKLSAVSQGLFRPEEHKTLPENVEADTRYEIQTGDFLLTRANTPNLVGDVCVVSNTRPQLMLCDLVYRVSVDDNRISRNYLCYWFLSRVGRYQITRDARGSSLSMVKVSQNSIRSWLVALPPYAELKAIASFLDRETAKIHALIAKKERLIELLQEKRTAIISHAVTKGLDPTVQMKDSGVEWLGKIPTHWEKTRIKYALHQIVDTEHKTAPFYPDGEYLVVRTSNVRNGQLVLDDAKYTDNEGFREWTKRGKPEPGDILFTREAPAGEACLVRENLPLCLGQRMVLFRVNHQMLDENYGIWSLYGGIAAEFISSLSQGSTVAHFNMADIGNIPLLLPPIEEQTAIASYLDRETAKIDALIAKIRQGIEKLKEYRTALISAAVTGKIDVRNEVAS